MSLVIISIIVNSYNIYVMTAKGSQGGSECNRTGRADVVMSPHPETPVPFPPLPF